jgi:hypothetical protein
MGLRWYGPAVPIEFNAALDPGLDVVPAAALARDAAFQAAVDAWNGELAAVGSAFRINLAFNAAAYAADQGAATMCVGLVTPNYGGTAADGMNAASTARDVGGAGADGYVARNDVAPPAGERRAPADDEYPSYDPNFDPHSGAPVSTHRLAETSRNTNPADADELLESEVLWFTHFLDPGCTPIPWDYDHTRFPIDFDFYSVMLHELGHFLGLDHLRDAVNVDNVMQPTIDRGQRQVISAVERAELARRYAPGAAAAGDMFAQAGDGVGDDSGASDEAF